MNLIDNLAVTLGRHQMKFGVDLPLALAFCRSVRVSAICAISRRDVLDAAMPRARGFGVSGGCGFICQPGRRAAVAQLFGVWPGHVESNAAINFDLRFALGRESAAEGQEPGQRSYGNVAPQVGVAYQFSGGENWVSVLRAGFGTFYDR